MCVPSEIVCKPFILTPIEYVVSGSVYNIDSFLDFVLIIKLLINSLLMNTKLLRKL